MLISIPHNNQLNLLPVADIYRIEINEENKTIVILMKGDENHVYRVQADNYNPMIDQLNQVCLKTLSYQNT